MFSPKLEEEKTSILIKFKNFDEAKSATKKNHLKVKEQTLSKWKKKYFDRTNVKEFTNVQNS